MQREDRLNEGIGWYTACHKSRRENFVIPVKHWFLDIGHGGSMYIMKIGKC